MEAAYPPEILVVLMRINIKRIICLFLLLALCLMLSGCRNRTTVNRQRQSGETSETANAANSSLSGPSLDDTGIDSNDDKDDENTEPDDQTRENPDASRKEYDENAPAEIVPGTSRAVHGEGDGKGAFEYGEDASLSVAKLNDAAEETATQTIAASQAEQIGVSEDAEEADSALTYYTVLLQDRMSGLFECQRLNVYWETAEDHVTVFKTSLEHQLILSAGTYNVSARLLEGNLRVDDGWIGRKNPGVIVKIVDSSVLGSGVFSTAAAQKVYAGLLSRDGWPVIDAVRNGRVLILSEELLEAPYLRTAAMLMIAKAANPDLFEDTEIGKALEMLTEEATGSVPAGIYYYNGQGAF